mmetsp:Transcript_60111/g.82356  ORF Transcript_60111/g.82356 Transcript_60111/m.82356 type:complete len:315 (-) Transcript_60111:355-1299(-)|eukprot:CAMPEP_0185772236 /NCGR_PEP_ID=MMETSP1174-20130828/67831_1 /TAXON_ID=35687 /ORGANISM="Dictyocha speculum, Strain CCMP1381" /LENGTH=314 /DNA_ID=CAMNT_0028458395 /DNA_START=135 /DNA_END=1079 /DNA_ORIENTATION=+
MIADDRTSDFLAVCGQLGAGSRPPKATLATSPAVSSQADFHDAASSISREIYMVSQKLAELTRLVQRGRSLFNDPASEISALVNGISEDIRGLNSKLQSATQYVSTKKAQLTKECQEHQENVVGELKSSLVATTKNFKTVVQQRSAHVKAQQERKAMFGHRPQASRLQQGRPRVYGPTSGLPRPNGTCAPSAESSEPNNSPLHMSHTPTSQQEQQLMLIPDQSYYESRENAMTEIETHIVELGDVFTRLGSLVEEHSELTGRILDNTTNALENTELAHERLIGTLARYASGRSLSIKIFTVLFTFFFFWLVFLV